VNNVPVVLHKPLRAAIESADPLPRPYGGDENRFNQHAGLIRGRLAYRQFLQTFAALAQFDIAARVQNYEERTRLTPLETRMVPDPEHPGEKIERVVRWREHWPESHLPVTASIRVGAGNRNTLPLRVKHVPTMRERISSVRQRLGL
jgi:hypothetical protein